MHFSSITEIWRRLDLPHNDLAEQLVDAARSARDPHKTLLDCPHNHHPDWHDRYARACRVAWRVAFRTVRETGGVPLITLRERPVIRHLVRTRDLSIDGLRDWHTQNTQCLRQAS